MPRRLPVAIVSLFMLVDLLAVNRSSAQHSSGRPLPEMPKVTMPVMFDTVDADRILSACSKAVGSIITHGCFAVDGVV